MFFRTLNFGFVFLYRFPVTADRFFEEFGSHEEEVWTEFENEHLSELRDTLLPRLMSGELDVSELDL